MQQGVLGEYTKEKPPKLIDYMYGQKRMEAHLHLEYNFTNHSPVCPYASSF